MTFVHYWVNQHGVAAIEHIHIDRGVNGGIFCSDMLVLDESERCLKNFRFIGQNIWSDK